MTNSSPPQRATMSRGPMMALSRLAISMRSLSPGAVAETVVDLLEVIEVEEHHGQAVARRALAAESKSQLFLETAAIGQSGDRIEARHPVDFGLRVAALGDVLDDQNGALA